MDAQLIVKKTADTGEPFLQVELMFRGSEIEEAKLLFSRQNILAAMDPAAKDSMRDHMLRVVNEISQLDQSLSRTVIDKADALRRLDKMDRMLAEDKAINPEERAKITQGLKLLRILVEIVPE